MVLSIPEEEGELASSQIKDVTVEMPPGLTVSPGGAAGLATVQRRPARSRQRKHAEDVPRHRRCGTVELTSAMLSEPLAGTIYLGEPQGEERFRFFIVAPGFGTNLKFATGLQPDSATGRLATTSTTCRRSRSARSAMNLNGGPDGLLAAPLAAGRRRARRASSPTGRCRHRRDRDRGDRQRPAGVGPVPDRCLLARNC